MTEKKRKEKEKKGKGGKRQNKCERRNSYTGEHMKSEYMHDSPKLGNTEESSAMQERSPTLLILN